MSGRSAEKMKGGPSSGKNLGANLKWIGAIGAIVASLATFFANLEAIRASFSKLMSRDEALQVNVGWITIPDPADLTCIAKKTRRFELSKDRTVSLLENDCLSELLRRADLGSKEVKPQSVGKSFFLLLENRGPRIDGVEVVGAGPDKEVVARVSALDMGTNVAVCMGFEGRSGYSSRDFKLSEVRLLPAGGGSPKTTVVDDPSASPGYGISDCGNFTYSYPSLSK